MASTSFDPLAPFAATSGPRGAAIALVGEAWGSEEALARSPFVGASGSILTGMLREAGLPREDIFITNLINEQPPDNLLASAKYFHTIKDKTQPWRGLHPTDFTKESLKRLHEELLAVKPRVIIATGNYALWALSSLTKSAIAKDRRGGSTGIRGPTGIMNWRGSMVNTEPAFGLPQTKLLPLLHPAAVMRQWPLRAPTVHDLRTRIPLALANDWHPIDPRAIIWAPGTTAQTIGRLDLMLRRLAGGEELFIAVDVETKRLAVPFVTCVSLCDSPDFAMSIPFVLPRTYAPYWPLEDEIAIIERLRRLLLHPRCRVIGQNFIYDLQYLAEYPAVFFEPHWDTMHAQHVMFPGTPKGLDYLSSLYCRHHRYWKEDAKEWDEKEDLNIHLRYNAEDALRTRDIAMQQMRLIPQMGLTPQWEFLQFGTRLALAMMRGGAAVDRHERADLQRQIAAATIRINMWFEEFLPQEVAHPEDQSGTPWWQSPTQVRRILLSWGLSVPLDRKSGAASTGKEAIVELKRRYPALTLLWDRLLALRSLQVFTRTFLRARLDADGRTRTQFNPAGTVTFRWSSSVNALGRGMNMQNVPKRERAIGEDENGDSIEADAAE